MESALKKILYHSCSSHKSNYFQIIRCNYNGIYRGGGGGGGDYFKQIRVLNGRYYCSESNKKTDETKVTASNQKEMTINQDVEAKNETNIFFIPDYHIVPAKQVMALSISKSSDCASTCKEKKVEKKPDQPCTVPKCGDKVEPDCTVKKIEAKAAKEPVIKGEFKPKNDCHLNKKEPICSPPNCSSEPDSLCVPRKKCGSPPKPQAPICEVKKTISCEQPKDEKCKKTPKPKEAVAQVKACDKPKDQPVTEMKKDEGFCEVLKEDPKPKNNDIQSKTCKNKYPIENWLLKNILCSISRMWSNFMKRLDQKCFEYNMVEKPVEPDPVENRKSEEPCDSPNPLMIKLKAILAIPMMILNNICTKLHSLMLVMKLKLQEVFKIVKDVWMKVYVYIEIVIRFVTKVLCHLRLFYKKMTQKK